MLFSLIFDLKSYKTFSENFPFSSSSLRKKKILTFHIKYKYKLKKKKRLQIPRQINNFINCKKE